MAGGTCTYVFDLGLVYGFPALPRHWQTIFGKARPTPSAANHSPVASRAPLVMPPAGRIASYVFRNLNYLQQHELKQKQKKNCQKPKRSKSSRHEPMKKKTEQQKHRRTQKYKKKTVY